MTTKIDLDNIERKARLIADWDEERDAPDQECVACKHSMYTPSELEPTALCNGCAQAYAAVTAPVVLALIARLRELEAEVDRAAGLLEASSDRGARKVWAASLRETIVRGAVLP